MSKKNVRLSKQNSRKYILNDTTPFVIAEAYGTARTNLIFSLSTCEQKVVVFTSCMPSEGKSTTCVNMSLTLAKMGASVLLIDADLRKPTVHSLLKINNKNGLSSIIGGFCSVSDAVNLKVADNLDVIVAGPIPPNPAELLASQNMHDLLKLMQKQYDYILIDTPPVNIVSDSQLMNKMVSGMIFVVKENSTTHTAIQDALQSIKLADGKVLGFMKVNCNSNGNKNYKGYKYNYKYDYKYEQETK